MEILALIRQLLEQESRTQLLMGAVGEDGLALVPTAVPQAVLVAGVDLGATPQPHRVHLVMRVVRVLRKEILVEMES
jgi:hypothetical protein